MAIAPPPPPPPPFPTQLPYLRWVPAMSDHYMIKHSLWDAIHAFIHYVFKEKKSLEKNCE